MISWSDVNSLENQKLDLQLKLNQLLNSSDRSMDEINGIRAEILYIEKQIEKIVGKNELARQEKLKSKKSGQTAIAIKNFEAFKRKYQMVSNIHSATKAMERFINTYGYSNDSFKAPVKVMR